METSLEYCGKHTTSISIIQDTVSVKFSTRTSLQDHLRIMLAQDCIVAKEDLWSVKPDLMATGRSLLEKVR